MIGAKALQAKVEDFSKTSKGKAMMRQIIESHKKSGKPLPSGSNLVEPGRMEDMAAKMISIIRQKLPESIKSVAASLDFDATLARNGDFVVEIRFDDSAIFRESLLSNPSSGKRTGEGVDNIVALLNNGYVASAYVYGYWDTHDSDDAYAWIKSKRVREPEYFMQEAVSLFNEIYGAEYGVRAELGSAYEDDEW